MLRKSAVASTPNLVSRGLSVYTTSGTAANVSSSNYNTPLTMPASTGTIWWEISSLTAAQKVSMMLGWYAEYGVDTTTLYFEPGRPTGSGGSLSNCPTAYTIKGSTQAAGAGAAPTTGISTILTRSSNGYASRPEWFSATGYNYIGMDITSSSGSSLVMKADIWDVSGGSRLVLQIGDSRDWFGNNHGYPHGGSVACDSLGNLMQPIAGFYAPVFCLGMSGAKAADIDTLIDQWLTDFGGGSGRIGTVIRSDGINDCLASAVSSGFTTPYQSTVNKCRAVGAKVICSSIGDTTASTPHANLPGYNSEITSIVAGISGAYNGTNEYQLYVDNPIWISGDGVHGTDTGFAGVRTQNATDYASVV